MFGKAQRSTTWLALVAFCGASSVVGVGTAAPAQESPSPEAAAAPEYPSHAFLQAELGVAAVSRDGQLLRAFAPSLVGGYRFDQLGVFAITGVDYWRSPTLTVGDHEPVGVYTLGAGGEFRYAEDFARSALAMGIAVLTTAPSGDEPGAVGFYFDLRPVGLRWSVAQTWSIGFDPLGFRILIPDLGGIPLAEIQFTTGVQVEWRGL